MERNLGKEKEKGSVIDPQLLVFGNILLLTVAVRLYLKRLLSTIQIQRGLKSTLALQRSSEVLMIQISCSLIPEYIIR